MEPTTDDYVNEEIRKIIENLLKEMNIKNHTMDISPGSVRGDNYLGLIAKVVIKGEDQNRKKTTLNLIVKSAPKPEAFRKMVPIHEVFNREIYVYTKMFPVFAKFQEAKGILKPFKPFAKYYGSTLKEYSEALIMEDMKELGFSLCDRREPLDYNHVMLVMREYGKLHALSYALRDQQPELFKELSENTLDVFFENPSIQEFGKQALREPIARALNSLDPIQDKVAYNKFEGFMDRVFDLILEMMKTESTGKYSIITHGDCWMNNILFGYKDSVNPKSPTEICVLDWQLTRSGSPAFDLSYFIFTCTDKQLRDQHYEEMIQEYYNSLKSFLSELGSDPEEMFPFEVLQNHLKKFSVFGLYSSILVLYLMTSESEEIPDFHNAEDIDKITENLNFTTKNQTKYYEKIRGVILDFVKYDYEF